MRVILLGNAADLLARERATYIDSADRVIRVNSFRIAGIEKFVGTAIDVVSLNLRSKDVLHGALPHSAGLIRQAREWWTPTTPGPELEAGLNDVERLLGVPPARVRTAPDLGVEEALRDAHRQGQRTFDEYLMLGGLDEQVRQFGATFLPTTGFLTVFVARAFFEDWHLQITGFGLTAPLSRQRVDTSGNGMWKGHHLPTERHVLLEGAAKGIWEAV